MVHGAHRDIDGPETTLTMVRLKGEKREKRLSAIDIAALAAEIHDLGSEVWSIAMELLDVSARKHVKINLSDDLGHA